MVFPRFSHEQKLIVLLFPSYSHKKLVISHRSGGLSQWRLLEKCVESPRFNHHEGLGSLGIFFFNSESHSWICFDSYSTGKCKNYSTTQVTFVEYVIPCIQHPGIWWWDSPNAIVTIPKFEIYGMVKKITVYPVRNGRILIL